MIVSPVPGSPARASRDGAAGGDIMSHSFSRNHLHKVFSTKERQRSISEAMQPEMWSYLAGICRNKKMVPSPLQALQTMFIFCFISYQPSASPTPFQS